MKLTSLIFILFNLLLSAAGFSQTNNSGNVINIYEGSSIKVTASSTNGYSFHWFKNGITIPNVTSPTYYISETGNYTVLSTNLANCNSNISDTIKVIVWPKPDPISLDTIADLSVTKTVDNQPVKVNEDFYYTITVENKGPNDATNITVTDSLPSGVKPIEFDFINNITTRYNVQTHTATWEIPELKESAKINLRIKTKAIVDGVLNNIATVKADQIDPIISNNTDNAIKTIYDIKLPNIFTPNDDNVNDTYTIPGIILYPENEFTVLNRWGNEVYSKKSYKNEWTGAGLNEGTYYYILKIKLGNKWEALTGYITLVRPKK